MCPNRFSIRWLRPLIQASISLSALILLATNCSAQPYTTVKTADRPTLALWKQANDWIMKQRYDKAAGILEELVHKKPRFIDAPLLLGELYLYQKEYHKSLSALDRVLQLDSFYNAKTWLFLSQIWWEIDSFAQCIAAGNQFLRFSNISAERKQQIVQWQRNALFSMEARKQPVPFRPQPLDPAINSEWPEYLPSLTGNEQVVVFTRRVGKGAAAQEDFFLSTKKKDQWQPAIPLSSINSPLNEGAQSLTLDGNAMYFVTCDKPGGYGSCDIYYARRIGDQWSASENLGPPVCTPAWETQPCIAPDGMTLYFVSNRPGGKGGSDIWIAQKNADGSWQKPINAGDSINTPYDEMSPFIHSDGKTLYFASSGHPGLGGIDLFMARKKIDGSWSRPRNLGYPINTKKDENSLIVATSGRHAYFASDRIGDSKNFDLFVFELYAEAQPQQTGYVSGTVRDQLTHQPVAATLELIDLETGLLVATSGSNPSDGFYLVALVPGRNYALSVTATGYLYHSDHFSLQNLQGAEPLTLNIALKPLRHGEKTELRNIFFDHDSHILKPESEIELNKLVALLRENASVRIRIDGHTDNSGSSQHNQLLSEKRARAVYDFLVRQGIDASRLAYQGFGETVPVADNRNEEGRARNRRTEITVIGE